MHACHQLSRREVAVALRVDEGLAQQRAVTCPGDEGVVVVFLLHGHELIGDRLEVELGHLQPSARC